MTLQGEALRLRSGQVGTSHCSTSHHLYSHQTQDLVVMSLRPQEDPYSWPAHLMVRPEVGSVLKDPSSLLSLAPLAGRGQGEGSPVFNIPSSLRNGTVELCNREAAALGEFAYPQAGWDRSLSKEGSLPACWQAGAPWRSTGGHPPAYY